MAETSRPRVHVTGLVPGAVASALDDLFEVVDSPQGAEGILSLLTTRVDEAYLTSAGPQLRIVANYGVGVDNIDLAAARRHEVVVANTPDVLTETTAELAIGLTLALLRRIAEGDRFLRAGRPWRFSLEFMLGEGLRGKRFGIVGPGRIGRATGRLAEAFGAIPVYAGRGDGLEPLLRAADVVSLHCPLTEETRHLIDGAALDLMRRDAVLVNTARGPIVDEQALVAALAAGSLAGAALDVFEHEPAVTERLLGFENVVLTPHLGSATRATREAMGLLAVNALRSLLVEGRVPDNSV
ncbi:MAG: D-glycerate dehydrogenase [Actinomycetota bacterium]|nr:D-glycerate dehydrogenase [Actinomycetota bacterium]